MVIAGHFQDLRVQYEVINRYRGHRQVFHSLLMYVVPRIYSVTAAPEFVGLCRLELIIQT